MPLDSGGGTASGTGTVRLDSLQAIDWWGQNYSILPGWIKEKYARDAYYAREDGEAVPNPLEYIYELTEAEPTFLQDNGLADPEFDNTVIEQSHETFFPAPERSIIESILTGIAVAGAGTAMAMAASGVAAGIAAGSGAGTMSTGIAAAAPGTTTAAGVAPSASSVVSGSAITSAVPAGIETITITAAAPAMTTLQSISAGLSAAGVISTGSSLTAGAGQPAISPHIDPAISAPEIPSAINEIPAGIETITVTAPAPSMTSIEALSAGLASAGTVSSGSTLLAGAQQSPVNNPIDSTLAQETNSPVGTSGPNGELPLQSPVTSPIDIAIAEYTGGSGLISKAMETAEDVYNTYDNIKTISDVISGPTQQTVTDTATQTPALPRNYDTSGTDLKIAPTNAPLRDMRGNLIYTQDGKLNRDAFRA